MKPPTAKAGGKEEKCGEEGESVVIWATKTAAMSFADGSTGGAGLRFLRYTA
jgi:hypothetical protein